MRNTVFRLLFGVIVFFLTVIGLEAFGQQGGSDTTREMAMASLPVISIQAGMSCTDTAVSGTSHL